MQILVLHQDKELVKDLVYSFENDGDTIKEFSTISKALKELQKEIYSVSLIGSSFSDGSVLDYMRKASEITDIPTIVLSREESIKNIVLSLEYGCDDFMRYPINMLELKARIRAVQRRITSNVGELKDMTNKEYILERGELSIHLSRQELRVNDHLVNLTLKEFHLLLYFVQNEGRSLTREEIARNVWVDDRPSNIRTVDVYIRRLRAKLEQFGVDHKIQTKWGTGYLFNRDFLPDDCK